MINPRQIVLIEACNALADRIANAQGSADEFKILLKNVMFDALNYHQNTLSYATKSYFARAIHLWQKHDPAETTWLLPCLTDIKYALMSASERPIIPSIDDLVSDLTYLQLLKEIERLA